MHLLKFTFMRCVSLGHCLATMLVHSVRPKSWKHWPIRLNSVWPSCLLASESQVKIFNLKSGIMNARKYLGPNRAWLGTTCPVISFVPFSKAILVESGCFMPSLIYLSDTPLAPKEVQQLYQLNWGVCLALMRSDIIRFLVVFMCGSWLRLLDRAELSDLSKGLDMPAKGYYNIDLHTSREADWSLECIIESNKNELNRL